MYIDNIAYQIDEPIGFDTLALGLIQNDKGYGRRITFGDSISLEFQNREIIYGHQFSKLLTTFKTKSLFADVFYKISVDTELILSAKLDFGTVNTDNTNSFKCDAIIDDSNRFLTENGDIQVNLLSTFDLLNNPISAINSEIIKLKARKIEANNIYNLNGSVSLEIFGAGANNLATVPLKTVSEQILDTNTSKTTLFLPETDSLISGSYQISTLVPINLSVSIYDILIAAIVGHGTLNNINFVAEIHNYTNPDFTGSPIVTTFSSSYTSNTQIDLTNTEFNFDNHLFVLESNSRLLIKIVNNVTGIFPSFAISSTISGKGGMKIYGTSGYVDTTANMSRLFDMGNQLLKSINPIFTGLTAPKMQIGGALYDLFCCNGYAIRNFPQTIYGWILTWNDYLNNIQNQFNLDYQINGRDVFIGHHSDFYQNVEVARLDFKPEASSFSVSVNPKNKTKTFEYNYKTFQDLQENKDNTIDSIHTQSSWMVNGGNQKETDTKEVSFIADMYKIEYARREGIGTQPNKSKQTDDSTYIIDAFLQEDLTYKNRSNEGFTTILNIFSPETAYNLRLSLKRLLLDNFAEYLANLTQLITNSIKLKNTFYKLNGIAKTQSTIIGTVSTLIQENGNIETFVTPLVTTHCYDITIAKRFDFKEYYNLLQSILNKKGYLNFVDTETFASIKIFPTSITYDMKTEKLNIKGEQKYE